MSEAVVIAVVGALGAGIGAALAHVATIRSQQSQRASSLEDNQRELIAELSGELRETRQELRQTSAALGDCKRELVGLLEQIAGLVRDQIDSIEDGIGDEGAG